MAQSTRSEQNTENTGAGRFKRDDATADAGGDREPESPTQLEKQDWKGVLKRTFKEFKEDNLTDWAAALTYYGVLSLFPGLLVLTSILGLLSPSATDSLIQNLTSLAPGPAREIVTNAVENLQNSQAAGVMFFVGIAAALWSASNYVGAFMRASNAIYEVDEGRPFWKLRPLQIAITALMVLVLAVVAMAVVVSGPLAKTVGDVIGLGDAAVTVFNIAKWPIIAVIFALLIAFLYYIGPNVKHPKFQWVSPGGLFAVVLWIIASVAFALYVANFPNNKTYGSLGGVIFFLTWLWISNVVILLGAEMNAEMERQKKIKEGMPESREPFLPVKDEPKKK
jgi:membrane protein